jgi:hypothetical protein
MAATASNRLTNVSPWHGFNLMSVVFNDDHESRPPTAGNCHPPWSEIPDLAATAATLGSRHGPVDSDGGGDDSEGPKAVGPRIRAESRRAEQRGAATSVSAASLRPPGFPSRRGHGMITAWSRRGRGGITAGSRRGHVPLVAMEGESGMFTLFSRPRALAKVSATSSRARRANRIRLRRARLASSGVSTITSSSRHGEQGPVSVAPRRWLASSVTAAAHGVHGSRS